MDTNENNNPNDPTPPPPVPPPASPIPPGPSAEIPPPPPPPFTPPPAATAATDHPSGISKDERMWACLCHIVPLIIWLIKREGMPFVEDQGKDRKSTRLNSSHA